MTESADRKGTKNGVLHGRDMLCFSHDWNGDPLSKTHLMRLLSKDNRVLWVNSIGYRTPTASKRDVSRAINKLCAASVPLREVEPNIHVLSPLIIPANGRPWVRAFNRWFLKQQIQRAMQRLEFTRAINWVFNPAAGLVAGQLGEETLIYYCVDEYTAFQGVDASTLAGLEREVMKRADLVIASSEPLYRSKKEHHPGTVLVRHGVDWDHFRKALDRDTVVPSDISGLPGPVLGYFGLIAEEWVDVGLVEHVARAMPQASIVMIGNITMNVESLRRLPNVHLLGHRPYKLLPAYCRGFDAALIPFPMNEATLHSNPLKAREYLAAGLPVVSTAIPEVAALECCEIGNGREEFVERIRDVLSEPGPNAARSDAVRGQSWRARLEEIEVHLEMLRDPALRFPKMDEVRARAA